MAKEIKGNFSRDEKGKVVFTPEKKGKWTRWMTPHERAQTYLHTGTK